MSKWMQGKEKIFNQFKEKKKQEDEQSAGPRRKDVVWKTPEKGTQDKPKTYTLRLLADKNNNFYKTFYYHMFKDVNGKWTFVFCPKSYNFENFCPLCSATMKLFQGSKEDKKSAYNYRRQRKHCGNVYVVKDPRDADEEEENEKNSGKVLIYEFPDKVESKIKSEMYDEEYGNGMYIFDPGEDGVDFILKVGATKPIQEEGPNKGKSFPDYSDSKFSNKPTPLAQSDEEIQRIIDSVHDLDEYLKTMERTEEEMIEIAKKELLWDLIKDDYPKNKEKSKDSMEQMDNFPYESDDSGESNKSEENTEIKETDKTESQESEENQESSESSEDDDIPDSQLLSELDDL